MEGLYNYGWCDQPIKLPPGFRLHPTDEELVSHYLSPKVLDSDFTTKAIGEVDLNKVEPWDLPWKAKTGEKEWYFFCLKDRKYPTGSRTNRATGAGYWKATGKDKEILRAKTLNEWVICRVFKKTSGGKKVHISEIMSSIESCLDLPPLMDFSSDENTMRHMNAAAQGFHVTCFSNLIQDQQDISIEEYSSSSNTTFLYPSSIFSSQPSPCTKNFHCPDSVLKQEQMTLPHLCRTNSSYMKQNAAADFSQENDTDGEIPTAISKYEVGVGPYNDDHDFSIISTGQIELDCLWNY